MTVRLANVGDTHRVMELLEQAFPASPFAQFGEFSPAMAKAQWLHHLTSSKSLCLVYEPAAVQGVFVAQALSHPSMRLMFGAEVVKWIDPAHRGRAFLRMVRWFERWGREQGCRFTSISGLAYPGYEPVETHYVKVL